MSHAELHAVSNTETESKLSVAKAPSAASNDAQLINAQIFALPTAYATTKATLESWLQLNYAANQRILQSQTENFNAWSKWLLRLPRLKHANTVSKLVEQEVNLVMSAGQLLGDQAVTFSSLLENFQVNYAYWLEQQFAKQAE